ncbi:DUF559 domain-containing protein [Methylobacterium sp. GXF4]|uniref:endonuclease domain-containing protein n=1 Tax=Methylobacterium sp. GXF4 TaxID=1096546 RepID=UPI000305DEFC|nr:DUF559 domain-containing protein [Methylobacterium sp. GXF4]
MPLADEPAPGLPGVSPLPMLPVADLSGRILGLGAGERLVLVGIGLDGIGPYLDASEAAHSLLVLRIAGRRSAAAILDGLLDDLADLALARWPDWQNPQHAPTAPEPHGPWLKAAAKHAAAGRPPRFRRAARSLELAQLMRAVAPSGLVLVAELDPAAPERAAPVIEVLEWCRRYGTAVAALFPSAPPPVPPYDRVLYGAHAVQRPPAPVEARFLAPPSRAHPASAVEKRVEAALRADAELGPLFSGNATVALPRFGTRPRVDLLWAAGRVVVELDGPEHRLDPTFSADRHRDYELLAAGYLVLRITNAQVETDLQRAVEKIRDVVRLRRTSEGAMIR